MRPPILWISVAFGAGLWTGLDAFQVRGAWYVVAPVLVGAAALHRRAPLGAALAIMAAAGVLWGGAAVRERGDTCAGGWSRERGAGGSKAAIGELGEPAPASGGRGGAGGGPRAGGGRGAAALRVSLAAGLSRPRHAGGRDAGDERGGPAAPARRGAARRHRAVWSRAARRGPVGVALGGSVALGDGDRRRDLGR